MTAAAARRARLLRLRTIEHRVAAIRLVAADAAHAAVASVSDRVTQLRAGIMVPAGGYSGRDLQSLAELSDRLDRARIGLQRSLSEAREVRDARDVERIAAHVAEERTGRVHAVASRREEEEREMRIQAARPSRLKTARARI
jgi:hypothetical protein